MSSSSPTPALSQQFWGYFQQPDKTRFIVSPVYDNVWFIFSPLIAIALGFVLTQDSFNTNLTLLDRTGTFGYFFYMFLTQGHLTVTFARSHLNNNVFKQYPFRFFFVPVLLLLAIVFSPWVWAFAFVLMIFWDVYHSSMQTFGLGRIYDAKCGNDALIGRRLDMVMNVLLYAGPVLGGAVLMDHFHHFHRFGAAPDVDIGPIALRASFFTAIPSLVESNASILRTSVIVFGAGFIVFYIAAYARFARQGYVVSWQKVFMVASTGICSIFAWGFNALGVAFLIMNIFHAVQYFALVWATEKKNLSELFNVSLSGGSQWIVLGTFLVVPLSAGALFVCVDGVVTQVALVVCALMHFYYDGFIWSVRKKQHLQVTST